MAWQKMGGGWGGESGDEPVYWYNTETGENSQFDPTPSGQYAYAPDYSTEGQSNQRIVDSVTGRPISDPAEQAKAETYFTKQLDDKFQAVIQNPASSSWDKAMAVQERYGVEALAQLAGQGHFADIASQLGPHIAARQAEGEAEGFSIGGNQLGLWPVALGTGAAALYGGTAAGAGGTAGGTATGATTGTAGGMISTEAALGTAGAGGTAGGIATGAAGTVTAGGTAAGGVGGGASTTTVLGTGAPAAGGAAGTATTVAGAAAGGTALSRILEGSGAAADYLSIAGNGLATGLGIYGANQQSKSLEDLAGKYMDMGGPSRGRYEASFAPGFNMGMDPGYTDALDQTTKSFLHKASIGGNPADSPNAWQQTLKDVNSQFAYPAMQNYRSMNANAGGLSRFAEAAPGVATGAIGAQRGVYDAIGYGAANVFNPPSTLEQLMRSYRGG